MTTTAHVLTEAEWQRQVTDLAELYGTLPSRSTGRIQGHSDPAARQRPGSWAIPRKGTAVEQATCLVDSCERAASKAGLCRGHYDRMRTKGDVLAHVPLRDYYKGGRTCSVDGCEARGARRGLCTAHLHRLRKHGDVMAEVPVREVSRGTTELARVLATVGGRPSLDECWTWPRALSDGYGKVGAAYTHRVICAAALGPIPEGLEVDHLCHNRACCNPLHLEPVTPVENAMRANRRREQLRRGRA